MEIIMYFKFYCQFNEIVFQRDSKFFCIFSYLKSEIIIEIIFVQYLIIF